MSIEAIKHYEAALKAAFPQGASGEAFEHWNKARTAIEAAEKQEPVAYSIGRTLHWHEGRGVNDAQLYTHSAPAAPVQELVCVCGAVWQGQELVEAPAAQRQWQGLTDEEINDCMEMSIQKTCRAIEAKLREKNGGRA